MLNSSKTSSGIYCIHFKRVVQKLKTDFVKGTFYSESAGEMWNRHIKVPKIVPRLLFPVRNICCSNKIINFTFFYTNKINVSKARTNMY